MIMLLKNYYKYIIVLAFGVFLGTISCSYFKNITINNLNNKLNDLNTKIIKQDNDYKNTILNIQKETQEKERQNYETYQKTINDNQERIDSLISTNSGLRVKIKSITSAETSGINSPSVGNGTSSGQGQTAELDSTTSANALRIMQRCDKYKEQLNALQDYINTYNKNIN